jgi:APA family basic amino acid/polyamine antiporter
VWLARITSFAALANLFVSYLGVFWPAAVGGPPRVAVLGAIVALLAVVNVVGVRPSTTFTNIFTAGKLSALLFFIVSGLFFIAPENYLTGQVPTYTQFSQTVLILVFAFTGFEMAVIPAGETINPAKNAPFGLLVGIPIVVLLYVSIQFVAIGTLPGLAASTRPLADASQRVLGSWAAAIVSAGALVSIMGTLNSTMLVSARLLYAMAEDRHLPRPLGIVHAGFRTPYVAIFVSAAAILALTLSGSFIAMAAISTVTRLLTYTSTCAALFAFRRGDRAPFVAPLGAAAAVVALALTAWLLSNSQLREIWMTTAAAVVGAVLYFGFKGGVRS